VLYYFYRKEATNSAGPAQSQRTVTSYPQTPQNNIEVLAFLTSPGAVAISIGGKTYTKAATAGVQSFTVPLAAGTPVIKLIRKWRDGHSSRQQPADLSAAEASDRRARPYLLERQRVVVWRMRHLDAVTTPREWNLARAPMPRDPGLFVTIKMGNAANARCAAFRGLSDPFGTSVLT
jgi:hypothetical protein